MAKFDCDVNVTINVSDVFDELPKKDQLDFIDEILSNLSYDDRISLFKDYLDEIKEEFNLIEEDDD
jgi:enoyl-[acyl-carrier-protein] reductase (NADH)